MRTWARAVVATALRWPLPQDRAEVMQRCSSVLIAPTFKTIGLQVTCHIVKTCHHIHPLNAQLCKPTHKTLPPLLICVLMGAQRREGRARKGTAGNKHAKTLSNTESGKGKFLDLMVRERGWRGMDWGVCGGWWCGGEVWKRIEIQVSQIALTQCRDLPRSCEPFPTIE